jgi:hypothetical protein
MRRCVVFLAAGAFFVGAGSGQALVHPWVPADECAAAPAEERAANNAHPPSPEAGEHAPGSGVGPATDNCKNDP